MCIRDSVGAVVDRLLDAPEGAGNRIDRLGRIGEELGMVGVNGTAIFHAATGAGFRPTGSLNRALADSARAELHENREWFRSQQATEARVGETRWSIAAQEMGAVIGAAVVGLRILSGETPSTAETTEVVADQRAAWLRSSRPGGLDDSLARLR